jgi:predicted phosphohydrolase
MPVTIQYASDLHLEFSQNNRYIAANPLKPMGNILLLAGDIVCFYQMDKHKSFFNYISENFEYTYWLPGNHEYYQGDIAQRSGTLHETIRQNVLLVNNVSLVNKGLRLVFSTLWTPINPVHEWHVERGMNDYQVIRHEQHRLSARVTTQLHHESLAFIKAEVSKSHAGKTIVVTHHVSTLINYPERYKTDLLNEAFAVELFPFIESSAIDFWIYGHHHCNTPAFTIGNTQMLTNQLGYVQQGEHLLFDNARAIALPS